MSRDLASDLVMAKKCVGAGDRPRGTLSTVSWQGTGCAFSVRKEFRWPLPSHRITFNRASIERDRYRQLYLSIDPLRVSFRATFCSKNDRGAGSVFSHRFARQIILLDAAGLAITTLSPFSSRPLRIDWRNVTKTRFMTNHLPGNSISCCTHASLSTMMISEW